MLTFTNGLLEYFIMRMSAFGCVVISLLTASCASLNKNECAVANWRALGYAQGAKGYGQQKYERYSKDCAKHQITADFDAFQRGHEEGLKAYCTFDSGLAVGGRGQGYNRNCPEVTFPQFTQGYYEGVARYCTFEQGYKSGVEGKNANTVCPSDHYPDYAAGFSQGGHKYVLGEEITEAEAELAELATKLERLTAQVEQDEALLVSDVTSGAERKLALARIKNAKLEQDVIGSDIHLLERKLIRLRRQYDRL